MFIVAVNCTEPGETCFCASMGTGPGVDGAAAYDLALTELVDERGHRFLVDVGSPRGADIMAQVPSQPADDDVRRARSAVEAAADHMGRQLEADGLRDLMAASHGAARWDDVAARCLTCGNCTMACPTCFCTSIEEVTDLTGEHAERWERWDSCFDLDFSYLHGGSVRPSAEEQVPAVAHPQARHLARPVRVVRLRRVRPVHRLVPGRHRPDRGMQGPASGAGAGQRQGGVMTAVQEHAITPTAPVPPMRPSRYLVAARIQETYDTVTLLLRPVDDPIQVPRPGQFTMLYAFGVGEVPVSVSGIGDAPGQVLVQTIRAVGAVTRALCAATPGDMIGVRGPFGTDWRVSGADGRDMLIVAGGIGLAPLRPVLLAALADRARGRVVLLVGARSPADLVFTRELEAWRRRGADVRVTVDHGDADWDGRVGLVTGLIHGRDRRPGGDDGVRVRPGNHDAAVRPGAGGRRHPGPGHPGLPGAEHALRRGPVRPLPARAAPGVP